MFQNPTQKKILQTSSKPSLPSLAHYPPRRCSIFHLYHITPPFSLLINILLSILPTPFLAASYLIMRIIIKYEAGKIKMYKIYKGKMHYKAKVRSNVLLEYWSFDRSYIKIFQFLIKYRNSSLDELQQLLPYKTQDVHQGSLFHYFVI